MAKEPALLPDILLLIPIQFAAYKCIWKRLHDIGIFAVSAKSLLMVNVGTCAVEAFIHSFQLSLRLKKYGLTLIYLFFLMTGEVSLIYFNQYFFFHCFV